MRLPYPMGMPQVVIRPGEIFATNRPHVISTLLGSCVAVCMFEPDAHIVGMNHIMLPVRPARSPQKNNDPGGKYACAAMDKLIRRIEKMGGDKKNLKAKVFGGAKVLPTPLKTPGFDISGNILRYVLEYLDREKIPILAKDFGGNRGRIIHFVSDDYSVYLKRINNPRSVI